MFSQNRLFQKRLATRDLPEEVLEWENHMIMRVPEDVAGKVNRMLDIGQNVDDLAIQVATQDMRNVSIRIGQHLMSGKIHDLPCVSEIMKTVDRRNTFKVADVTQIMICSHDRSQASDAELAVKSSKREQKQWQYPHGLTPPMKSVRRRRFRKTKKKKYMDAPEVEKELKRLLRADIEADTVTWEIVSVEDKKKDEVNDQSIFGDKVTSSEDEDAEPKPVGEEEKDD